MLDTATGGGEARHGRAVPLTTYLSGDKALITTKTTLLSSLIGLTAVALMTGCSAGANADSGSGHDPGTGGSAAGQAADAHGNGHIAGVLKWSGDSSGRHVYKTADCGVSPGKGKLSTLYAPILRPANQPLSKMHQPYLAVVFDEKGDGGAYFTPHPSHHRFKVPFQNKGKFGHDFSWNRKGNTYVLHLRHFHVISQVVNFSKENGPRYDAYLTGDITCTKIDGTKVEG
jgi:hypothetical protein